MKVVDYLKKINKLRNPIKLERWVDLKQYYMSMYQYYMLKLYDLGYISDPTRYCEVEIVKNLINMGIYDFKDETGLVLVNSMLADFARCKYTADEDRCEFLELLCQVLKYKEYCLELDKQYELNPNDVRFSFALKDGILVSSLCMIDYNKGVFTTLCEEGYSLGEISINKHIFDYAMRELGVGSGSYGSSMFVNGLSLEDTIKFSNIILEGRVDLDGKYGKLLQDWLTKNTENGKGLYYYTCRHYSEALSGIIEEGIDALGDDFVLLYGDKLYFKKPIKKYRLPASMFVCVTTKEESDIVNTDWCALYGYTGEAYTREYLDSQYIDYVGIPITVSIGSGELQVYDYSQLILPIDKDSWFKVEDANFSFEEDFTFLNPYEVNTLEYKLFESYIEGRRGGIYEIDPSMGTLKEIKSARKKMLQRFVKSING